MSSKTIAKLPRNLKLKSLQNREASKENPHLSSWLRAAWMRTSAPVIRPASMTALPTLMLNDDKW